MSPAPNLTIAVPRGALLADTLDLLDRLGVDTSEVRGNDRKLLFEDVGVITMRPSDVPTYVEAGAADLGITGKDVLLEQASTPARRGRMSTSCWTWASAPARWCWPPPRDPTAPPRPCAAWA